MKSQKSFTSTEKNIRKAISDYQNKFSGMPGLEVPVTPPDMLPFATFHFWKSTLLTNQEYLHHPLLQFALYPVPPEHAGRWVHLFYLAIDENLQGQLADKAKGIAANIARKLEREGLNKKHLCEA